ncbi:DNA repair protein RAD51-like protein 3 [Platysternon megacephalum]|uniref:peptide-methionine (S)-S-oxide reductase n=1 Tax=Platysternon megacephalum TaxID=55544 RepID=A0A4D9F1Q1_9SAUR|nr:DNA repair protein RAD51-like protein 3 [Platysternon megacephalum]
MGRGASPPNPAPCTSSSPLATPTALGSCWLVSCTRRLDKGQPDHLRAAMPGKTGLPRREEALPGRPQRLPVSAEHAVSGNATLPPFPEGMQMAVFGMGCFWGAEKMFWKLPGIFSTQVGYAGGFTPNPTYKEICTGLTGHAEVVRVVYDPQKTSYEALLKAFWENHDPTQGMQQEEDVGTQYRSVIHTFGAQQRDAALKSKAMYQQMGNLGTKTFSDLPGIPKEIFRHLLSPSPVRHHKTILPSPGKHPPEAPSTPARAGCLWPAVLTSASPAPR